MAGIQLSNEAFKRIAAATKKVERTPTDRNGGHTPTQPSTEGFWAMLLGADISGQKYSFNKVRLDPASTQPDAFIIARTIRYIFDGDPVHEAAFEVNASRGIEVGTVVWLRFAGYDTNNDPVFVFQYPAFDPYAPLAPHDHRDNLNGGFSFATFHPGTSLPQNPWGI